jgi:hypothetical protein
VARVGYVDSRYTSMARVGLVDSRYTSMGQVGSVDSRHTSMARVGSVDSRHTSMARMGTKPITPQSRKTMTCWKRQHEKQISTASLSPFCRKSIPAPVRPDSTC